MHVQTREPHEMEYVENDFGLYTCIRADRVAAEGYCLKYSRPSLSRLRFSRFTAYLEEKI